LTHLSGAVTTTLHNLIAQNQTKLAPLRSQQIALQQAHSNLNAELSHLQSLHATLTSNLTALQSSLSSADRTIADAKSRASKGDIPAVDGMLITPHVVSTQLYNVVAEERGLEAAILALQEAFTRGRVGSEVWSKKTRELSREEFKRRWVGRKIGRGMGLEGA
jgi:ESCRT-I complex subunit TSG101